VRDDTTLLHEFTKPANSSPTSGSTTRTHVVGGELTLAAGTHRLNLAVVRVAGTGTITVAKSATSPSRLTVNRVI
jgi:hypothetical protein